MPDTDFSLKDLYDALDAQRLARGLSWPQVMRDMQGSKPASTPTRRLSQSTVTGTRIRTVAEGDGVLAMLRWLNRSPESFVPGHRQSDCVSERLPDVLAGKVLRFDAKKIYAALDARRIERAMTWPAVAKEIGASAAGLKYLAKGKRVGFPGVMRIFRWLGSAGRQLHARIRHLSFLTPART